MAKTKLKAMFVVTVRETEEEVHTQITGIIAPDMDTMDRADIALRMIKSLGITVSDVVLWWQPET